MGAQAQAQQSDAPNPQSTLQVPKPEECSGVKTSPNKKSKKERKRENKALQAKGPEPFIDDDKDSSFEDLTQLQKIFKSSEPVAYRNGIQHVVPKKTKFAFTEKEKALFSRPRLSDIN